MLESATETAVTFFVLLAQQLEVVRVERVLVDAQKFLNTVAASVECFGRRQSVSGAAA